MSEPVAAKVRFTRYEDFRRWTEQQPGYWILVHGAPMPSPSPSRIHQEVVQRLFVSLARVVRQGRRGWVYVAPLDVKLREDTIYQPDLLVVLREHADRLRPTHIEGAPDLVMEVLSPGTAHLDLWEKRYDYAQAGVQEYWIVDPETQRIELYVREGEQFRLHAGARCTGRLQSVLLPDLEVELESLFREL